MKRLISMLFCFTPMLGFGDQISCADLLFSAPLKNEVDLLLKARSYKVDWGHYYNEKSVFEFSYRNTSLKWGTRINLIYGFLEKKPYKPDQNWKNRTVVELDSVSDFTWGSALQVETRTRFEQYDKIQFVLEIIHPDGIKTYENGNIDPMGFLTARVPSLSNDDILFPIEVGAVDRTGGALRFPKITPEKIVEFHQAIDSKNANRVTDMIQLGKEIINSFHPEDGYTPLVRASRSGDTYFVRELMRAGADPLLPEAKSMNALAGHKAAFQGHIDALRSIFEFSNSMVSRKILETQGPKNGKTVLMDALWIDRPGLPPEYQVSESRIPIYVQIALFLIRKSKEVGANLELRNNVQETALDIARRNAQIYPIFSAVVTALE